MMYKLHTWRATKGRNAGQFYWHVKARNTKVVCQGEGYLREADMLTMLGRLFKGSALESQVEALKLARKKRAK